MQKISAIIITKNAQSVLADCLMSVSFCDEIIVVDNGSTDETIQIAKKHKAVVVSQKEKDFSLLRNKGKMVAKGPWLFYIDADERVDETLKQAIQKVAEEENTDTAAYRIKRKNIYFATHPWPRTEHMVRLFRKEALETWYGIIHESPRVNGAVRSLPGYLLHFTHTTLETMLEKTTSWAGYEAALRLEAHHPFMTKWRFMRVILTGFWQAYGKERGWRMGTVGMIESIYQAYSMLITYIFLWEKQKKYV